MTAPEVVRSFRAHQFAPTPIAAWRAAHNNNLRINAATRRQALLHAAAACCDSLQWLAEDRTRWVTVDRMIDPTVTDRGAMFGLLIAAVATGFGPVIQSRLDGLAAS